MYAEVQHSESSKWGFPRKGVRALGADILTVSLDFSGLCWNFLITIYYGTKMKSKD